LQILSILGTSLDDTSSSQPGQNDYN